jgi:hypothetical protein
MSSLSSAEIAANVSGPESDPSNNNSSPADNTNNENDDNDNNESSPPSHSSHQSEIAEDQELWLKAAGKRKELLTSFLNHVRFSDLSEERANALGISVNPRHLSGATIASLAAAAARIAVRPPLDLVDKKREWAAYWEDADNRRELDADIPDTVSGSPYGVRHRLVFPADTGRERAPTAQFTTGQTTSSTNTESEEKDTPPSHSSSHSSSSSSLDSAKNERKEKKNKKDMKESTDNSDKREVTDVGASSGEDEEFVNDYSQQGSHSSKRTRKNTKPKHVTFETIQCKNCGEQNSATNKLCHRCHKPTKTFTPSTVVVSTPTPRAKPAPATRESARKRKRRGISVESESNDDISHVDTDDTSQTHESDSESTDNESSDSGSEHKFDPSNELAHMHQSPSQSAVNALANGKYERTHHYFTRAVADPTNASLSDSDSSSSAKKRRRRGRRKTREIRSMRDLRTAFYSGMIPILEHHPERLRRYIRLMADTTYIASTEGANVALVYWELMRKTDSKNPGAFDLRTLSNAGRYVRSHRSNQSVNTSNSAGAGSDNRICGFFNKERGCYNNSRDCGRRHECSQCHSRDHGAHRCNKKQRTDKGERSNTSKTAQ